MADPFPLPIFPCFRPPVVLALFPFFVSACSCAPLHANSLYTLPADGLTASQSTLFLTSHSACLKTPSHPRWMRYTGCTWGALSHSTLNVKFAGIYRLKCGLDQALRFRFEP